MLKPNETALLPEGLHDTLVGDAIQENKVIDNLLSTFIANGYDLISPPLVEFEESLLLGPGKAQSRNMFRLMDPASQRMMGVRTDMTGQVARIAQSRLGKSPRPLRLSYAGDVLRVKGTQLRPERQFKQAGVELIGSETTQAYVEIILLAHSTLKKVGVKKLSVDLTLPLLVPTICQGLGLSDSLSNSVRHALNTKDIGELNNIDGAIGDISRAILTGAGPADKCLSILSGLDLPKAAQTMCDELTDLVSRLKEMSADLLITIDPGEYTGFEYQTGISFCLFAGGVRGELGRGGRYLVNAELSGGEPATGFSLYLDSLMRALGDYDQQERVFVGLGTERSEIEKLHDQGYRTVQGLTHVSDIKSEAKRMECENIWSDGQIKKV